MQNAHHLQKTLQTSQKGLFRSFIVTGKATLDNVIDKIKEAIKKRSPDLDENAEWSSEKRREQSIV